MRPTKYLSKWSRRDRGLAEGLLAYEASLNEYGVPRHLAEDPDRRFAVDETVDFAAAAVEEAREEYQRGENTSHGLRLVVIDQGLPPLRGDAESQEQRSEGREGGDGGFPSQGR